MPKIGSKSTALSNPPKPVSRLAGFTRHVKPYVFHGVNLEESPGNKHATGDCPFCGREGKFSVVVETGLWRCLVCGEGSEKGGGNIYTFIRVLHSKSAEGTKDYSDLRKSRKLLFDETLQKWGVVKSIIDGAWLVPGYNPEGKLSQLYRYVLDRESGKHRLLATPEMAHGIHGVNLYESRKGEIYLTEGPWDAMALWEVLRKAKPGETGLGLTGAEASSLSSNINVLAVPGCNVFQDGWASLFEGSCVTLLFDSDHPKTLNGKEQDAVGYAGMKRVSARLGTAESRPEEVRYVNWGEKGYDPTLPSGYDLRDHISVGADLKGRIVQLDSLMDRFEAIPDGWLGAKKTGKGEVGDLDCLPCTEWKEMIQAWRKAMKWTEGLDRALSVMLACITSTRAVGDQLWAKIVGPPACLDGDTPIYDPLNKTTLTVRERCERGTYFYVYSRVPVEVGSTLSRLGRVIACPPQRFDPAPMFRVTFKSGVTMDVTGGHRFWDGTDYVTLEEMPLPYALPKLNKSDNFESDVCGSNYDVVERIEPLGEREYFDFHVPIYNNYWACGFFHHNCGKSTLCEALSVNKKYIVAKSTLRGFHSGYQTDAGGEEDHSLVAKLFNKTLVTKDGDTLLQSPNVKQILSEARDVYDRTSRTSYRNKASRSYEGINMTWLLCGTSSLRELDSSELGERFLDCVIMETIDDDLEDEILLRKAHQAERALAFEADGTIETQNDPDMTLAMRLTGGYVSFLRENARDLLAEVTIPDPSLRRCIQLGKFVAYMRARPSKSQEEKAEREFATRLVSQLVRLSKCLAVVLNRKTVDEEVLRRVTKVALDTSRGRTLEIAKWLYQAGDEGLDHKPLAMYTNQEPAKELILLRFLRRIGAVETFSRKINGVLSTTPRWRLTPKLRELYKEVMEDAS